MVSAKGLHRHGCPDCQRPFEDACGVPTDIRGRCYRCRTGRPGLYDQLGTFDARPCCYDQCRPARRHRTKSYDELAIYRLCPSIPWYLCNTCHMTFPYRKPRKESHDSPAD